MKIIDIEQRSDEWFSFREGKISGSKAKTYTTPRHVLKSEWQELARQHGVAFTAKDTIETLKNQLPAEVVRAAEYVISYSDAIYQLMAEKIARPINANDYAELLSGRSFSMAVRGEILEDEARTKISQKLGKTVIEGRLWQADFNDNIICSPDGEIADKNGEITEAVEIKCLDSWKQLKAFYENQPPSEYRQQIVQYFLVNEKLEKLYFAMYSDVFGAARDKLELLIFTINREDIQAEIDEAKYLQTAVLKFVDEEITKLLF